MAEEKSYGIIPLRLKKGQWKVFVVKHRAGHWAFPKGHAKPDETPQETAARELKEETGLSVSNFLSHPPLQEHYHFSRNGETVQKTVTYFLAETRGKEALQEEEISDGLWTSLNNAHEQITFPEGKGLCLQAEKYLG